MRRVRIVVGVLVISSAGCALITSLDDLSGGGDGAVDAADAQPDSSTGIPPACATLDAGACVATALPAGWSYALFVPLDQACPSSYAKASVVYDLALDVGACTCGCAPSGTYDCIGPLALSSSSACSSKNVSFDGGKDAACIATNWSDPHVLISGFPTPSGSPTCKTNVTGNRAFSTSLGTACIPTCSADFCQAPNAFQRCVTSTTGGACPAPFTQAMSSIGLAADVVVTCDTCACTVSPSPGNFCQASVSAYNTSDCSGSSINGDADIFPGSCYTFGGGNVINSVSYAPIPPKPTCTIADGGNGTVGLSNALTLCCMP